MNLVQWQWMGPLGLGPWLGGLLALVLAGGLARSWSRMSGLSRILASVLGAGLLLLTQDPLRVVRHGQPVPLRGIVVVDSSASVHGHLPPERSLQGLDQALSDIELLRDGAIRWDVVSLLDASHTAYPLDQVRSRAQLLVPGMDDQMQHRTDLADLYQVLGSYDLALVLTDGHWWQYEGAALPETSTTILGVRPPQWSEPAADIGFRRVRSEVIGLLRHKVRVEFELDVRGLQTATDVLLDVEGAGAVAVTTVTLVPGAAVTSVTLDLLVTQLGSTEWHARLTQLPAWDGYELNNEVVFRVMGYREKIRTLLVSGGPGMDTRNLRAFLKSDPAVELMHFAILRTIEDDPRARNEELSLIPFPYEDLFTNMLPQFDVVILQNFNFKPYFRQEFPKYFGNLAQSVFQSGTGLIMTGGARSFGDGDYEQTVLGNVLGLDLRRSDGFESDVPLEARAARVPPDIALPELIPRVSYFNQVLAQPGTIVGLRLAQSVAQPQGVPLASPPLLTYHRHGRGHAVGILSPDLFVARSPAQFGALSQWFSQTLRWAAGDLDQFPLDVVVSDPTDDRSVDVRLQARQIDASNPLTAAVQLETSDRAWSQRPIVPNLSDEPVTLSTRLPLQIVRMRVLACVSSQQCQAREFYLDPLRRERQELWQNPSLPMHAWSSMRDLDRTGLQLQSGQTVTIESESREHLAANPWVGACIVALAFGLWLSQRRLYRAVV